MIESKSDFATKVVASHNETFDFCNTVGDSTMEYYTYRPLTLLIASRNAYLTEAMHHRPHQAEY